VLSERTKETIIAASVAASVSGLVSFTLQHSLLKPSVPKAVQTDAIEALRVCALFCNGHRPMAVTWESGTIASCQCDFNLEDDR